MGRKKKKGNNSKREKEYEGSLTGLFSLAMDEENQKAIKITMLEQTIEDLHSRVNVLVSENKSLKIQLKSQNEDQDAVVDNMHDRVAKHEYQIQLLQEEQVTMIKDRDAMQTDLSMKVAQQSRELKESNNRINDLKAECKGLQAHLEEAQEAQIRNVTLEEQICDLLDDISKFKENDRVKNKMVSLINSVVQSDSILPLVINAMIQFDNSTNIQLEGCTVLLHLLKSSINSKFIIQLGTVSVVVLAMQGNSQSAKILTCASKLLWKLSYYPEAIQEMNEQDVIALLLEGMSNLMYNKQKEYFWSAFNIIKKLLPQEEIFVTELTSKFDGERYSNVISRCNNGDNGIHELLETLTESQIKKMSIVLVLISCSNYFKKQQETQAKSFQILHDILFDGFDCVIVILLKKVLRYLLMTLGSTYVVPHSKVLILKLLRSCLLSELFIINYEQVMLLINELQFDAVIEHSSRCDLLQDSSSQQIIEDIQKQLRKLRKRGGSIYLDMEDKINIEFPVATELIQKSHFVNLPKI